MQGHQPTMKLWDLLVSWRGPENLLFDLADRPDFMHAIIARLAEAQSRLLDRLEEKNLLGAGQPTIHCSGAHTDELPAAGTGLMGAPTAEGLRDALERALRLFADPLRMAAVQKRGMARDFGWKAAAAGYEKLYQESL